MARTQTTKEKKPDPPKLLDPSLFSEIDGLVKVSKIVVIHDEVHGIEIPDDRLDMAVNVMAMARHLATFTDKAYKAKLAEIVAPVDAQMKQVASEKKSIVSRAEELARDVEAGLQGLVRDGVLTPDGHTSKQGCRLTLIGKDELSIVDASLIPDEFLLPREACIDRAKIKGLLDAEKAYRDALPEGDISTSRGNFPAVPGAQLVRTYTFRTKLPEEVE